MVGGGVFVVVAVLLFLECVCGVGGDRGGGGGVLFCGGCSLSLSSPPPPHLKLVWGLMHQWYGIFIWPWPIIIMLSLGSSSSTYLRYHERLNTSPRYTYQQQKFCSLLKQHLSNRSILFSARFSSIPGKPFSATIHNRTISQYLKFQTLMILSILVAVKVMNDVTL